MDDEGVLLLLFDPMRSVPSYFRSIKGKKKVDKGDVKDDNDYAEGNAS